MRVSVIENKDTNFVFYLAATPLGFTVLDPSQDIREIYLNSKDESLFYQGGLSVDGERECSHLHFTGSGIAAPADVIGSRMYPVNPYMITGYPGIPMEHHRVSGVNAWISGPIFTLGDTVNLVTSFPDASLGSQSQKETRVTITSNGDTYTRTYHCLFRTKDYRPYSEYNIVDTIVYDRINKTWSYNGRKPWSAVMIGKSKLANDAFSEGFIPTGSALKDVESRLTSYYVIENEDYVFGDLVRRCANDAQLVPANSIELISELKTMSSTLKDFFGLAKGKIDVKKLASAYLQYKYGLRLTMVDLLSINNGLIRKMQIFDAHKTRTRAREVLFPSFRDKAIGNLMIDYNYKITYATSTDHWRDFIRNWFDTGLFPSLTNAWDLVPFSFVVDWFLHVDGYLDAIDSNTYWSTHSISSIIYSTKKTFSDVSWILSDSNWTLTGDIKLVNYTRRIRYEIHKPLFFDPSPRTFNNYAELSALFIVNKK